MSVSLSPKLFDPAGSAPALADRPAAATPRGRASWSGLLRLSLVAMPIKAYPVTSTSQETHCQPALAGTARRFAGPDRTPAGAGAALFGGSGRTGEGLLRGARGPGTGGHDRQAPGQPLPAGAAVGGLAEDQAMTFPIGGDHANQPEKSRHGRTLAKRERNPGHVLDNRDQSKQGNLLVDMERNFATIELTKS